MTTTDPKLIERASLIAEQAYSAGNLVTCDGYYEFDLDAAAAVIAAAINEAAQKERAGIVAWLRTVPPVIGLTEMTAWNVSAAIERGEHLPPPPAIEAKESQHG